MKFFTLDRGFLRQDEIDKFTSGIWTERYYGDSEVELVVPATEEMIQKLPEGKLLALEGSKEVMMLETADIKKDVLKVAGISLLSWMNNRFIRASAVPEDRYYNPGPTTPGALVWTILYYWCIGGEYLNRSWPTGISNPEELRIPNLGLKDYDKSGPTIDLAVPYGPVYDAMRAIATTYEVGMTITLESASDTAYSLQFLSYKGIDRTSRQSERNVVRFSPEMDNLINTSELRSIKGLKTRVYSFAPSNPVPGTNPNGTPFASGYASLGGNPTGFDLRALMTFEEDITTDQVGSDPAVLSSIMNQRAQKALEDNRYVKAIDGEIVPGFQYQYGRDYNLGDLIEIQGRSGISAISRVTEYIRTQDAAGERSYPTVAMLE